MEAEPLLGTVVSDHYLVDRVIADGAMGRVYLAYRWMTGEALAMKVLFGELALSPSFQARFAREAAAAASLQHPNVVSIVDFGQTQDKLLYIVMEYVDGPTLRQILEPEGPMTVAESLRLTRQLASGLAHAHARGFVHRDFKPANVLVAGRGPDAVAKIMDFGFVLKSGSPDEDRLTGERFIPGTPSWMSPEQAGGMRLDGRSDFYALGLVLYTMLAGRPPFDNRPDGPAATELPPLSALAHCARVPPAVEALIRQLTAERPQDRPDASAVIATVDAIVTPPA